MHHLNAPDTTEAPSEKQPTRPEALTILGAFSSPEDVALMDEVLELIMHERERCNTQPPLDITAG